LIELSLSQTIVEIMSNPILGVGDPIFWGESSAKLEGDKKENLFSLD